MLWGAWPFHRATWTHLKHRAATMDTLISVGVLAAWVWSLYAVVAGDADTYLETASVITTFALAGRYLEARAKRRAGAAIKALLELGAKDVAILDGTAPSAASRSRSSSRAAASWCAPARGWPRTVWSRRAPRLST